MDTDELVRNPDELACQSHGCYNRGIMQHVRSEHDPARWTPEAGEYDWRPFPPKGKVKVEVTFNFRGRGKLNPAWLDE